MILPVLIRPEAEADLDEVFRWYERRQQGLGAAFLRAADDVIIRVQEFPEMYLVVHRDIRRALLAKVPMACSTWSSQSASSCSP